MTAAGDVRVLAVAGMPDVKPGDDIANLILTAMRAQDVALRQGDLLVVAQKVVSKAEGRLVCLADVEASDFAVRLGKRMHKDPRQIEVVLREARRIVRMDRTVIIAETRHGFVCANAGVDESNVTGGGTVSLLPIDPDRSAAQLRTGIARLTGIAVPVIISDTFGRPWREGLVNVAIGVAGLAAVDDMRGEEDATGFRLKATIMAVADELASAAELVMGKSARVPAALIRGYPYEPSESGSRQLIRPRNKDMFR